MTCIAWDGKTLAADRHSNYGNMIREAAKIHRLGDALVGYSGSSSVGNEVIAWFAAGADPAKFPEAGRSKDDHVNLLVIKADGAVFEYSRGPYPERVESKLVAIGSGRDFAVAAMHLGCDAFVAVEVACKFDSNCGMGIDTLTF